MAQRRFTAAARVAILAAVAGKPTGVICALGGMEFDLVAPTTAQLLRILGSLEDISKLDSTQGADILKTLGTKGPDLLGAVRDLLYRSAFYGVEHPDPADIAVFDEWFGELDPLTLFKTISGPVIQAAGAAGAGGGQGIADPSPATATAEAPVTPLTPSG
jgi:hypothetical protein